ncbi:response regulator transcription factor [Massilia cavernae]|uniref:DNA-binding response regulator n=1 Tax=Massilia cavernae TaxID=2320864 RepID=A0A418X7H9_9BURK|nr:response regulator transcription factor [Massilia cavernae]RJG08465.1 DNA-binding response regulator [Massilia cavernae]
MRILIVEDNPDILANLYGFLEPYGHTLDSATNGYGGLALASQNAYDVIVLDVTLPGLSGTELCQRLRTELNIQTPVLMLTARDTLQDKVAGFSSGADDYLVKPFSLVELELRLAALARRSRGNVGNAAVLNFGDLSFDTATYRASRGGRPLSLTRTGFILLKCLMQAAPRVVPRAELEAEIWGENPPASDALRTHIHALRLTLDKPEPFPMLRTVPGIGFQLVAANDNS